MSDVSKKLAHIRSYFENQIQSSQSLKELDALKVQFFGKSGIITELLKEVKNLTPEDKRTFGPLINQLRQEAESLLETSRQKIVDHAAQAAIAKEQNFDVTAYKPCMPQGSRHPYTQFVEEVEDIFLSMGYEILDGPELETDFYNFTGLNIPQDHPARDMYDTLWTNRLNLLMRTHTSPVQVRTLESRKPPIAAIVPGRVYRHEAVDASHDFMFMQCEGFYVDEHVNMSHLFATAQSFLKALFKKNELDIRIRPGFFPFVEPGVEIDMRCPFCTQGCSTCKRTRWIEIFPGGLIHPNVLKAAGIDPEKYSGFAFGFGLSRLAMLKYGINDIRLLHSGKIKFLEQF